MAWQAVPISMPRSQRWTNATRSQPDPTSLLHPLLPFTQVPCTYLHCFFSEPAAKNNSNHAYKQTKLSAGAIQFGCNCEFPLYLFVSMKNNVSDHQNGIETKSNSNNEPKSAGFDKNRVFTSSLGISSRDTRIRQKNVMMDSPL